MILESSTTEFNIAVDGPPQILKLEGTASVYSVSLNGKTVVTYDHDKEDVVSQPLLDEMCELISTYFQER